MPVVYVFWGSSMPDLESCCSTSMKEVMSLWGYDKVMSRLQIQVQNQIWNCLWAHEWQFQASMLFSMIYAAALLQTLMAVCCNVLLQGVVYWESTGLCFTLLHHHHIHTNTKTHKNTHITCVHELSRYWACIIWASYKTVLCFFLFFPNVWRSGCSSLEWWNTGSTARGVNHSTHGLMGKYGSLSLLARRGIQSCHFIECECITDSEATLVCAVFQKYKLCH